MHNVRRGPHILLDQAWKLATLRVEEGCWNRAYSRLQLWLTDFVAPSLLGSMPDVQQNPACPFNGVVESYLVRQQSFGRSHKKSIRVSISVDDRSKNFIFPTGYLKS